MVYLVFLAFVGLPIAEIVVFIVVGREIGVVATVGIVLATAVAGAILVRHQGLATLARARAEMAADRIPADALAEGVAILAAGALLLTPGFVTDAAGFLLLVPPARRAVIAWMAARLDSRMTVVGADRTGARRRPPGQGPVIEGEAVEIDAERRVPPQDDGSPWRRE